MHRVEVGVAVHGHGPDAEPPGRLHHPAGDLAPVGDQDLAGGGGGGTGLKKKGWNEAGF